MVCRKRVANPAVSRFFPGVTAAHSPMFSWRGHGNLLGTPVNAATGALKIRATMNRHAVVVCLFPEDFRSLSGGSGSPNLVQIPASEQKRLDAYHCTLYIFYLSRNEDHREQERNMARKYVCRVPKLL
jgi:hypothetical protein